MRGYCRITADEVGVVWLYGHDRLPSHDRPAGDPGERYTTTRRNAPSSTPAAPMSAPATDVPAIRRTAPRAGRRRFGRPTRSRGRAYRGRTRPRCPRRSLGTQLLLARRTGRSPRARRRRRGASHRRRGWKRRVQSGGPFRESFAGCGRRLDLRAEIGVLSSPSVGRAVGYPSSVRRAPRRAGRPRSRRPRGTASGSVRRTPVRPCPRGCG